MPKPETKGKIVSFKAAREVASSAPTIHHAPEKQPPAPPSKVGGYAEVWLKAHTDKDALIKENLALKKHQKELEQEKQELAPTFADNAMYYALLAIALCVGIVLALINRL